MTEEVAALRRSFSVGENGLLYIPKREFLCPDGTQRFLRQIARSFPANSDAPTRTCGSYPGLSTYSPSPINRKLSVIIADDESSMRNLLGRLLSSLGYSIAASACNGLEAVEMTRAHRPDFVFLDIAMPVMNGLDAARQILLERELPIIVCSGIATLENREKATQLGVREVLSKPFTLSQLKESLQRAGVWQESKCTAAA